MPGRQEQIVLHFIDCWRRLNLDDVMACFAPEAEHRSDLKSQPYVGHAAIRALLADHIQRIAHYEADVLNIAVGGNVVFLERIERLTMPDGRELTLPIAAVFELNDAGLIAAWRDYWDTSMATPPPQ